MHPFVAADRLCPAGIAVFFRCYLRQYSTLFVICKPGFCLSTIVFHDTKFGDLHAKAKKSVNCLHSFCCGFEFAANLQQSISRDRAVGSSRGSFPRSRRFESASRYKNFSGQWPTGMAWPIKTKYPLILRRMAKDLIINTGKT